MSPERIKQILDTYKKGLIKTPEAVNQVFHDLILGSAESDSTMAATFATLPSEIQGQVLAKLREIRGNNYQLKLAFIGIPTRLANPERLKVIVTKLLSK